jgi:hypothetical protein
VPPPAPDAFQITLARDSELGTAVELARFLDDTSTFAIILPFAALTIALLVAPNRKNLLLAAGALLILASLGQIAAVLLLRDVLAQAAVVDRVAVDAAVAVYDVSARSFIIQTLVLAGAGLAVALFALVMPGKAQSVVYGGMIEEDLVQSRNR